MPQKQNMIIDQQVRDVFHLVYPETGYNRLKNTLNNMPLKKDDVSPLSNSAYHDAPSTMIAAAMGNWPAKRYDQTKPQSLYNIIIRNGLDWDKNKAIGWTIPFHLIMALLILASNLFSTGINLIINFIKLGTEFVPAVAMMLSERLLNKLDLLLCSPLVAKHPSLAVIVRVLIFFIQPFNVLSTAAYFIGCAITSPHFNLQRVRHAYRNKQLPLAYAVILGVASLSITSLVYLATLPILVKLMSIALLSYIASHAVHLVAAKVATASKTAEAIGTGLAYTGRMLARVLAPVLSNMKKILSNACHRAIKITVKAERLIAASFRAMATSISQLVTKISNKITGKHILIIPPEPDYPPITRVFTPSPPENNAGQQNISTDTSTPTLSSPHSASSTSPGGTHAKVASALERSCSSVPLPTDKQASLVAPIPRTTLAQMQNGSTPCLAADSPIFNKNQRARQETVLAPARQGLSRSNSFIHS